MTAKKRTEDIVHGRISTYNNHKCRCVRCKEAWKLYTRKHRGREVRVKKDDLKIILKVIADKELSVQESLRLDKLVEELSSHFGE